MAIGTLVAPLYTGLGYFEFVRKEGRIYLAEAGKPLDQESVSIVLGDIAVNTDPGAIVYRDSTEVLTYRDVLNALTETASVNTQSTFPDVQTTQQIDSSPKYKQVFISGKALERAKKDSYVRSIKGRYDNEIDMIARGVRQSGSVERIGGFNISPMSKMPKAFRVAWHTEGDKLFIDDFLYHTDDDYNGKWNDKVKDGKITLERYKASGYEELKV